MPRTRKPTKLTLPSDLLAEAQQLRINPSQAAESGIRAAVQAEKERLWKERNKPFIDSYNEWIEKNGVPLAELRKF
jgi:antitoxin CcdA